MQSKMTDFATWAEDILDQSSASDGEFEVLSRTDFLYHMPYTKIETEINAIVFADSATYTTCDRAMARKLSKSVDTIVRGALR